MTRRQHYSKCNDRCMICIQSAPQDREMCLKGVGLLCPGVALWWNHLSRWQCVFIGKISCPAPSQHVEDTIFTDTRVYSSTRVLPVVLQYQVFTVCTVASTDISLIATRSRVQYCTVTGASPITSTPGSTVLVPGIVHVM